MRYCEAKYQRTKKAESNRVVYKCSGAAPKSGPKSDFKCKGRVAFLLKKQGGVIMEARDRLAGYRLHSDLCEFSKHNTILIDVAHEDDSPRLKRKKKHKRYKAESTDQSETVDPTPSYQMNSENSSADHELASSTIAEESDDQRPPWQFCGKCKINDDDDDDGRVKMIQCDLCSIWFHFECEHISEKEAEEEQWFCSVCREPETVYADKSTPETKESERVEFLDQRLNAFNSFLDYLIEEPVPAEERFKDKLHLCQVKLEAVLSKYGEDEHCKDEPEEEAEFFTGRTDKTSQDFEEEKADSPVELIGVGRSYRLACEEEYERMCTDRISTQPRGREFKNGYEPNRLNSTIRPESGDSSGCEPVCIVID